MRGKVVEGDAGRPHPPRAREGDGARAFRPDRVREDVAALDLDQHGALADERQQHLARPRRGGRRGRGLERHRGGPGHPPAAAPPAPQVGEAAVGIDPWVEESLPVVMVRGREGRWRRSRHRVEMTCRFAAKARASRTPPPPGHVEGGIAPEVAHAHPLPPPHAGRPRRRGGHARGGGVRPARGLSLEEPRRRGAGALGGGRGAAGPAAALRRARRRGARARLGPRGGGGRDTGGRGAAGPLRRDGVPGRAGRQGRWREAVRRRRRWAAMRCFP